MSLPSSEQAYALLYQYVTDPYQRLHARMVAECLSGYAELFGEDTHLWYITGLLHDIDFERHPGEHPGPSLGWFREWGYPEELIHAVEAHAYGYNGYLVEPETKLAKALIACDEVCGIFYAYQKLNPIPYGDMKASSILKRIKDKGFAPKIERETLHYGVQKLGLPLEEHIEHVIDFLSRFDAKNST